MTRFRVVRSPGYTPAMFARSRRYSNLADALAAMGGGLVLADDGRLVAFHENQLRWVA